MSTEIHTKRLTLRKFRATDAARLVELIGDIAVSRWLTQVPHPYTTEDAGLFIDGPGTSDNTLAVTLEGVVAGGIGLENELGFWLGKEYWGKGYASEAAHALVSRHFNSSTEDVRSGYLLGNVASSRLLSSLGFVESHLEDVQSVALQRDVKVQKMSLSASTWEAKE